MFERLTYRKENGEVRTASGAMDIGDGLKELAEKFRDRLAAYEDSGLSPEEVQKLNKSENTAKTALAYREMLERLEWIEHKDWLVECCPFCKKGKNQGHAPDCELAKLLKGSEVEEG